MYLVSIWDKYSRHLQNHRHLQKKKKDGIISSKPTLKTCSNNSPSPSLRTGEALSVCRYKAQLDQHCSHAVHSSVTSQTLSDVCKVVRR